ncbi:MAG: NADH-ubiquinone oxidoreductase-F iron-sulfur binding region domain-containing protein, partial [Thermoanaerobaculia bacterium]
RIEQGEGSPADTELLLRICRTMDGTTLCPLADAAIGPLRSLVMNFGDEVAEHLRRPGCPLPQRRYFEEEAAL